MVGYRFLRLLDVSGREISGAVLMVRVTKALCKGDGMKC